MRLHIVMVFLFGTTILAVPVSIETAKISAPAEPTDNDEYVVYPDVDRDEDVVYAYHAINDK
ncbi:uncharacterized protein BDZ99DRAFT_571546 [Mytilinidion resinicola]|uniref:Uncharacterized protein n=1 Tax=Mytilinidion resinicola TaxID=574789 RepID=A0A6A6YP52_9PEZI|nr:uncharacterized protein BDZ99DRAFT_571546 [Mytilinidion resinicola]KAF2809794.1 hypothetical protein BDZ99DRAFT_571546 [Mytilinidion resinicola]